jgi:hypothetical protein
MSDHEDAHLSQLTRQHRLKLALKWAFWIHVIFIVVATIGLPSLRPKTPFDMTRAVNVDLVSATGEFSAAPNKTAHKGKFTPNAKPTEAPKPPKSVPDKPPTPVKSDAAKKEEQVKKPEPKPVEKPKQQVEKPKKEATEKAAEKVDLKPEKEKKQKSEDDNKGEAQKQEEFNSLLKNLLGDETTAAQTGNPVDAPYDPNTKVSGSAPTTSETLQLGEMDALRHQLAKCWNLPAGAMNAEDLIVDIRIEVNPDRTVKSAEIVDQSRYGSDSFFAAAADSARRAVFNPMCNPLALPPDKYEIWKDILIRFNPQDMLGG